MSNFKNVHTRSYQGEGWFPRDSRPTEGEGFGPYGGRPIDHESLPYGPDLRTEGGIRRRNTGYLFPEMVWEPWIARGLGFYDDYSDHPYIPARYPASRPYQDHPADLGGTPSRYRQERDFWQRAGDEMASWFGNENAERRREMDRFRGVGPRGYKRPDSRITEDVCDRLSDDPVLDASGISVQVSDGEVTLDGQVSARWDKRRAEDCADVVSGVQNVQNNLKLRRSPEQASND